MNSLLQCAACHDTDKNTVHSYLLIYDQIFSGRRAAVQNVLEIGVLRGGSMRMWRDYFPNAQVFGIDLTVQCPTICQEPRVSIVMDNAYQQNVVDLLSNKKYDLIVDDGSHELLDIFFFIKEYAKLLTPKGVMVIEDIQNPDWIPKIVDAFGPNKQYVTVHDLRNKKGRYDDIMIVMRRP